MPLTGQPLIFGQTPPARPALVVKIDNAPAARPQTGFNAADIVYEEIVNDNLTRFAMVFHSQGSDPVGPIRSGRLQDVDLFGSFHRPLFAWSGGNATVTRAIQSSDFVELNQGANGMFRQRGRRSPHNLYGNTTQFWEQAIPEQGVPPQQFSYRNDGEAPLGVPAAGADVQLDSIRARWTWDPATGLYYREMNGAPHTDAATGDQVIDQQRRGPGDVVRPRDLGEPRRPERGWWSGLGAHRRQPRRAAPGCASTGWNRTPCSTTPATSSSSRRDGPSSSCRAPRARRRSERPGSECRCGYAPQHTLEGSGDVGMVGSPPAGTSSPSLALCP